MQLFIIFVSAFLIRSINLNQSLWLDETIVAKVVKTIPFQLIPFQFSQGDFHPPLYYLLISLWTHIFGNSEIALRMPSVIFSLIAGWFVYKIGCQLFNKKQAVWATLFFLFNPLCVYYSQEARMYMMATALLTIALYYFLRVLKEDQKTHTQAKNILFFNIFSSLAVFTFYGSLFFIGALILWRVLLQKRKIDLSIVWGPLLSVIFLSPLVFQQLHNAKVSLVAVKNWSLVLGKVEIKNGAMIFLKFATGRISWLPKWSYYLLAGIPTAITWLIAAFGMKKSKFLSFLFVVPLLMGLLVSFFAPMLMYFRFLYLLPILSLLIARGIPLDGKRVWSAYFFIGVSLIFSCIYLLNPQFHREDWRRLAQQLNTNTPVYMILPSSDPLLYYRNDVSVFELRNIQNSTIPEHIDVIPYTAEIYGLQYENLLHQLGCVRELEIYFRGDVRLEKWNCLKNA